MHLPAEGWAGAFLEATAKCKAVVVGPGLGTGDAVAEEIRAVLAAGPVPLVIDADALTALGDAGRGAHPARQAQRAEHPHAPRRGVRPARRVPAGRGPPGRGAPAGRIDGAVVLLKGPLTAVADPERGRGGPTCCSPRREARRSPPPAAATSCRGSSARSAPAAWPPSMRPRWRRTCTAGRRHSALRRPGRRRPPRPAGPAAVRAGRGAGAGRATRCDGMQARRRSPRG